MLERRPVSRMDADERGTLARLTKRLAAVLPGALRERADILREILSLHQRVWSRLPPSTTPAAARTAEAHLGRLAEQAVLELGGIPDRMAWSIHEYDDARYGPLLGVSDDGGAASHIVAAMHDSPKARVLRRRGELSIQTVGGCLDAERMSAAGELLVGPAEYARCAAAAAGRVPVTTNVGTVVLPRFFRHRPQIVFKARGPRRPMGLAISQLKAVLAPYVAPPGGGNALPTTVFVAFRGADRLSTAKKIDVLSTLQGTIASGQVGDPQEHRLGLLQRSRNRGSKAPLLAIDIAAAAAIQQVIIEGDARYESQDQLLLPGLLAFYPTARVGEVLAHAASRGIVITPKNQIDVATSARTIWVGLTAARSMGASLGKYGLFPLTLPEQFEAMAQVQPHFGSWTATPAFYVDRPVVSAAAVHEERGLMAAAKEWLAAAAKAEASVVLFDSPDRTPAPIGSGRLRYDEERGRRMIKRNPQDSVGVLTMSDVHKLLAIAQRQSPVVRTIWAGGLDGRQAFDLARHGAFGIYTTSTTARRVALTGVGDPSATSAIEPTFLGVSAVKMVIEAGFLAGVNARKGRPDREAAIVDAVEPAIVALESGLIAKLDHSAAVPELDALRGVLEPLWEDHLAGATAP